MSGTVEILREVKGLSSLDHSYQLILFNDDVNTFDDVISGLMTVIRLTFELAAKIATEAHKSGQTVAHVASKDECQKMKNQLQNEYSLQVQIEQI